LSVHTVFERAYGLDAILAHNYPPGPRVAVEGNYAIYYVSNETEVNIACALHGARDAETIAQHGGFSLQATAGVQRIVGYVLGASLL